MYLRLRVVDSPNVKLAKQSFSADRQKTLGRQKTHPTTRQGLTSMTKAGNAKKRSFGD